MVDIGKKLQKHTEPTIILGDDDYLKPSKASGNMKKEPSYVDLKEIYDDLKALSFGVDEDIFKDTKKDAKIKMKISKIKEDISIYLKHYKLTLGDKEFDDEKVLDATLQRIEDYFYIKDDKDKCNMVKLQIAYDVLKIYFPDLNEKRLKQNINKSCKSIKYKTSFYRRNKTKIFDCFAFFFNVCLRMN